MMKCSECKRDIEIFFDYEECEMCLTELLWELLMGGVDKEGNFSDDEIFKITSDYALELLQRRHGRRLDEEENAISKEERKRTEQELDHKRKLSWMEKSPYWDKQNDR